MIGVCCWPYASKRVGVTDLTGIVVVFESYDRLSRLLFEVILNRFLMYD